MIIISLKLYLTVIFLVTVGIFTCVTLGIVMFAKKFNCREKLFNDGKIFTFLGKRKDFKKGIEPSITDGALIYTIALIALIHIGSFIQAYLGDLGLVITEIMIIGIPLLYAIYIKADIKKTFNLNIPRVRDLFGAFLVWIGGYFIVNITTQIMLSLFPEGREVLDALNSTVVSDSFIKSLIVVAVMPAICEEALFRGFLLSAFKSDSKKSKIGAVVMVGILFGIMHFNFIRIIPTAILGILFTYCALKTNSIWTSVFMHFLNNGFSVIVLYLVDTILKIDTSEIAEEASEMVSTMPQLSSIIYILLIGGIFIYLGNLCFKKKKEIEN